MALARMKDVQSMLFKVVAALTILVLSSFNQQLPAAISPIKRDTSGAAATAPAGKPAPANPTTVKPAPANPTTVKPAPANPIPPKPAAAKPAPAAPATVKPAVAPKPAVDGVKPVSGAPAAGTAAPGAAVPPPAPGAPAVGATGAAVPVAPVSAGAAAKPAAPGAAPKAPAAMPAVPASGKDQDSGIVVFAVREAKSGKRWSAKPVSYRFELPNKREQKGGIPAKGPVRPIKVIKGMHNIHVTVGGQVIPPKKLLIVGGQRTKVEILVGDGSAISFRQTFEFDPVAFTIDKSTLLEAAKTNLDRVVELLDSHSAIKKMSIEGFTGTNGTVGKNLKLSKARAKTVYYYLMEGGIAEDRLEFHGYGPERPIGDNATPAGRALNRRIEFSLLELGSSDEVPKKAPDELSNLQAIGFTISEGLFGLFDSVTHPWIFAGVDIGNALVLTREPLELNKSGSYYAAKGLIDFYFPQLTVEAGGGIFNATFEEKSEGNIVGESASIQTVFIQGGARYPFDFGLEAGIIGQIMFGAANDFGPVTEGKHENYFMGVEALYQPPKFQYGRIALAYLQDYTINTRDVGIMTLGLQLGFHVRKRPRVRAAAPVVAPVVVPKPLPPPEPVPAPVAPPPVKAVADARLYFTARESKSETPLSGRKTSYKDVASDGQVVSNDFFNSGPTPPVAIVSGRHHIAITVGAKTIDLEYIVQADMTIKIEVITTKGEIELRQLMEVGPINFNSSNATILPESITRLLVMAKFLKATPAIRAVSIGGFTDSSGVAVKNLELSKRRAEAIFNYLVGQGVAKERLEWHGLGDKRPVADNATVEGRTLNRRVEFLVKTLDK